MKIFTLFLLSLVLSSCKKETAKESVVEETIVLTHAPAIRHNSKLKRLADQFLKNTEEVITKLKSSSPEEANRLFDGFEKKNAELIAKMNKVEETITNDYYSYFFNNDGTPKQVVDSLRQKQELLQNAQLELWEVGEGMAEIRPVHDLYLNIFKYHVTSDYKEYLELQSVDDSKLWVSDAAIVIPLPELANRVINWENFLNKNSGSRLTDRARLNYLHYQYSYLFGFDNTPTYEYNDVNLYPETVIEFKRFIEQHPKSATAQLAQQMLNNNGKGFEQLREMLLKAYEDSYDKFHEKKDNLPLQTKLR